MAVILTWQDWRVEQINLGGRRLVLRIRHGRYLMGYAETVAEALAILCGKNPGRPTLSRGPRSAAPAVAPFLSLVCPAVFPTSSRLAVFACHGHIGPATVLTYTQRIGCEGPGVRASAAAITTAAAHHLRRRAGRADPGPALA